MTLRPLPLSPTHTHARARAKDGREGDKRQMVVGAKSQEQLEKDAEALMKRDPGDKVLARGIKGEALAQARRDFEANAEVGGGKGGAEGGLPVAWLVRGAVGLQGVARDDEKAQGTPGWEERFQRGRRATKSWGYAFRGGGGQLQGNCDPIREEQPELAS